MTLQFQVLQDYNGTGQDPLCQSPLWNFLQWLRNSSDTDLFEPRFQNQDVHQYIFDLGDLHDALDEWYGPETEEDHRYKLLPPPPDIREWLGKEMDAGRYLAWVSW